MHYSDRLQWTEWEYSFIRQQWERECLCTIACRKRQVTPHLLPSDWKRIWKAKKANTIRES